MEAQMPRRGKRAAVSLGYRPILPAMLICLAGFCARIPAFTTQTNIRLITVAGAAAWVCLAVLIVRLPRVHAPGSLRLAPSVTGFAVACAVLSLGLQYTAALFFGSLGRTPYDISPKGLLNFALVLLPPIVAQELLRAYLVSVSCLRSRRKTMWLALITLFFVLINLNTGKLLASNSVEKLVTTVAKDVGPLIAKHVLLTFLAYRGGTAAPLAYACTGSVILHTFPVVPVMPWLVEGAIGMALPFLSMMFINDEYEIQLKLRLRDRNANMPALLALLAACVTLVWYTVGVFPTYPLVVLTGSMEPLIHPGDVVIIRKPKLESDLTGLAEGDIINYSREDITITHRITRVEKDKDGNVMYETRGDNNDSVDSELVHPNNVNGTVAHIVPGIGLPVIWMHSFTPVPDGVMN